MADNTPNQPAQRPAPAPNVPSQPATPIPPPNPARQRDYEQRSQDQSYDTKRERR